MAILPDGAVALNYFLAATDAGQPADTNEGFAVHIIEADGEPRLSLDGIPMKDRFDPVEDADRHLQVAPDGSLLVAHRRRYRIDRWDPATGELLRTFVREADWVRDSGGSSEPPSPSRPPATTISAMHMDDAGRLWLNVSRPAPDWRDRVQRTVPAIPDVADAAGGAGVGDKENPSDPAIRVVDDDPPDGGVDTFPPPRPPDPRPHQPPARAASGPPRRGPTPDPAGPARRKSRRRSCCRLPLAGRGISPCPAPRRPRCDAGIIRPARTAAGSGCSPRCCRSSRTGS